RGGEAVGGEIAGGLLGGDVLLVAVGEDVGQPASDAGQRVGGVGGAPAQPFGADRLPDSPGRGYEVLRVSESRVAQLRGVVRFGELVVGGAGDDAAAQSRDRVDGEGAA